MADGRSFTQSLARTAVRAAGIGLCVGIAAATGLAAFPGGPTPVDPEPYALAEPATTTQLAARLDFSR